MFPQSPIVTGYGVMANMIQDTSGGNDCLSCPLSIGWEVGGPYSRATAPVLWEKQDEVAQASDQDASQTPPWYCILRTSHLQDTLGMTQDTLETLWLPDGLGSLSEERDKVVEESGVCASQLELMSLWPDGWITWSCRHYSHCCFFEPCHLHSQTPTRSYSQIVFVYPYVSL